MSKRIRELRDLCDILSIAITREVRAQEYYQDAWNKADSEHTRKMLAGLVKQEKGHETMLRKKLAELEKEIEQERGK